MTLTFSRLQATARPAILEHLTELSADDRFTRFGLELTPPALSSYVDSINFNRDIVIGAHYRALLIGVVHIAVFQHEAYPCGELGISVDSFCQGKGIGRLLFEQALEHARRRKVNRLRIQYLRRNGRMASLCRGLSTYFAQEGAETACQITLAEDDPANACRYEMLDGIEVFHADARQPHGHVLFIHGVAGDGWQWRENILPWFAAHGLSGSALSLRGHGGSAARQNQTLRGYEEDVQQVLAALPGKPGLIVGHSMGGFLTQRVLEGNDALQRASLICSVPPWGLLPGTLDTVVEFMGDPLGKAIAIQAAEGKPAYVNPDNVSAQVQVIGGSRDKLIPPEVVAATARSYDTTPVMIEDAGHAVISSSKWQDVAEQVLRHLLGNSPSP